MKAINNESAPDKGTILSEEQHLLCSRIAKGKGLHSQRAKALLTLDQNVIQAEAATKSGLTRGQVKYLAARFRKVGMSLFPESLIEVDSSGVGELSSSNSGSVKDDSTPSPPKTKKEKNEKPQKGEKMKKDKKAKKKEKEKKVAKAKKAAKAKAAKKAAKAKKAKAAKKAKKSKKAKKAKAAKKGKKAKKGKSKKKKK